MPPSGQLDATSTPPTARTIATSPSRIRWTRVRLSIGAPARGASSVCSGSVSVDGDRAERERRQQRACPQQRRGVDRRSEEHTSELQSLMRISYAVFCLKQKKKKKISMNCT